jgi:hypothetical protein
MNHALILPVLAQAVVPSAIDRAVLDEVSKRPLAAASDIYKLLHQSVFGPGHIIQDKDSARAYLLKEMESAGPTKTGEQLYEEIGGGMVRVNIRPFRDSKGSTESLLQAMIDTANSNSGTPEEMAERINEARRVLSGANKKELADELKSLADKHADKGYPAAHHSENYRNAYKPAYRIIDKRYLTLIIPNHIAVVQKR